MHLVVDIPIESLGLNEADLKSSASVSVVLV
jgi:hypothetical protein